MKVKLLDHHIINDAWQAKGTVIDLPVGYAPTPLMEGLDDEAKAAVAYAHLKAFGRYPWPYGLYPPSGQPLDDPPIPRPLEENQPVWHFSGAPEYGNG